VGDQQFQRVFRERDGGVFGGVCFYLVSKSQFSPLNYNASS